MTRPATPETALAELLAGNHRFVTGVRIHPHQDAEHRAKLAQAQRPFAVVFGCSDSRLAAEIIFDRGLGDLFVVRTAGHIVGPEVLSSIEYGVSVLGAPLVVVLGHDSCGAVLATMDTIAGRIRPDQGLRAIIDRVTPSVETAAARGVRDADGVAPVHVERTMDMITEPGTALAAAVAAGTCGIVGLTYRLTDGRVTVAGSRPRTLAESRLVTGTTTVDAVG